MKFLMYQKCQNSNLLGFHRNGISKVLTFWHFRIIQSPTYCNFWHIAFRISSPQAGIIIHFTMLLKPLSFLSLLITYKNFTNIETNRIEKFNFLCTSLSATFLEGYIYQLDNKDIIGLKDLAFLSLHLKNVQT